MCHHAHSFYQNTINAINYLQPKEWTYHTFIKAHFNLCKCLGRKGGWGGGGGGGVTRVVEGEKIENVLMNHTFRGCCAAGQHLPNIYTG